MGGRGRATATFGALLVLAFCCVALFWPWLDGTVAIPWDARSQSFPNLRFLADALAQGSLPGWNPYVWSGWPQLADPQALVFSLPHLVLAAFEHKPSVRDAGIAAIFPLFLGAIGIFLHCRDRHWRAEAGLFAGVVFMFGGVAVTRLEHVGQIQSLAMLAFTLWPLFRAIERGSLAWGLVAGLTAGLMAAAPNQVAFLGVLLLAGLALPRLIESRKRGRAIAALAVAAIAGAVCIAVPFLLVTDLLAASNRPEIDFREAAAGSLHPAFLLTSILPNLLGTLDPGDFWGPGSAVWGGPPSLLSPAMGQMYFGMLPFLLLLVHGVAGRRLADRAIRPELVALGLMTLYALGAWTPLFELLFDLLPGVDLFRRPADAAFPMGLLIALLCGYLVHRLLEHGAPKWSKHAILFLIIAACGLAAGALVLSAAEDRLGRGTITVAEGLGLGLVGLFILFLADRWRWGGLVPVGYGLVAILALDLAAFNGPNLFNAAKPESYAAYDPNPVVQALRSRVEKNRTEVRRDRVEILGLGGPWQNASMVHRLENTLGYNPLRLKEYEETVGAWENSFDASSRRFVPLFPSYHCMMSRLLGLRWIVTGRPVEEIDRRLRPGDLTPLGRIGNAFLYENPDTLPRILLVPSWRRADFALITRTGNWGALDPRRAVLLEEADDPALAGIPHAPASAPAEIGSVAITKYEPDRIEIDVRADAPGLVVLNDVWHPGWKAELDGQPVPVHRANVLFRAVATPRGTHRIVFTFAPVEDLIEAALEAVERAVPDVLSSEAAGEDNLLNNPVDPQRSRS